MKKADDVRARLVLTHNMFLDVLNQWCKDGHVSEKELREMETHGLQMRPLPQNAHDFEYFEESCN